MLNENILICNMAGKGIIKILRRGIFNKVFVKRLPKHALVQENLFIYWYLLF